MKERRKLFEALEGCDGEAVHSFVSVPSVLF